ncbi:uncharacterized protein RMCC_3684 [Mycolicibacterium canariasense]|uniref:Cyclase/dehydrase n=1 Tax=Mycolicibacterium canariasense TaxID=228230 RepID=A0A100WEV7_MYCCR|nr:SRPBCC family protein [Mycolicibacterium canariasense]MCV7210036.1 SRPBCC family protein [Mycolicibacterium canariasense]ORV04693.1 hypothetical protein AWB94_00470 [Mycolicibacterium canariasense]GAS96718.1 uncharacterized protein RMCC_3684 [Mycolicibacterium canariasense]
MQASVTVHMDAPADQVWNLIADIRNTPKYSPEVFAGNRPVNNWHYALAPAGAGTDVTESFRMTPGLLDTVFGILGGQLRTRRNIRDMTTTLNRIKAEAEVEAG